VKKAAMAKISGYGEKAGIHRRNGGEIFSWQPINNGWRGEMAKNESWQHIESGERSVA
jgi:hypothetical protein